MKKDPIKILVAPDKFKGSLTACEVSRAVAKGLAKRYPQAVLDIQPMADGGDGSIDLLLQSGGFEEHRISVKGPLYRTIEASYYTKGDTAFIELAKASGLALLNDVEKDALKTSTYGTGELILDAYQKGCKKIRLFIGGSASNDAATGIADALGCELLDANGHLLSPTGDSVQKIHNIKFTKLARSIRQLDIQVVCDVHNPFYGPNGAAYIYAPQKGADENTIEKLDQGLRHLDSLFIKLGLGSVQSLEGAGAAGGVGGGMVALFGASLVSGVVLFIEQFNLADRIREADLVISGEGALDQQSFQGKVVGGIAQQCVMHQKPLVVVCGQNALDQTADLPASLVGVHSIMDIAKTEEVAINEAATYIEIISQTINVAALLT